MFFSCLNHKHRVFKYLNLNYVLKRHIWLLNRSPKSYDVVKTGRVSPRLPISLLTNQPDYSQTGKPEPRRQQIEIKKPNDIIKLKNSCNLAKSILNQVQNVIKIGITTDEIDRFVHRTCLENGAYPSPLNYHGFPKSVCTSVNNVACHGIPDDRKLMNGDILTVDVSVFVNGFHGDCAWTFSVGEVDEKALKLMRVTKECLEKAILICQPGMRFNQIGEIIENHANLNGFEVIPCFCGHGIGSYFHGPPNVLHYANKEKGIMETGMTFTIEPVLSEGQPDIEILDDKWTAITLDESRTAQYEHTILITENGAEILTI